MKKNRKLDSSLKDPIDVWNDLRAGEKKCFPNNFLDKDICKIILRNLVLEELKLSREEILNIDQPFLKKYKLGGIRKFFDQKMCVILEYCFPEYDIKTWELKKGTPGVWKDINQRNDFVMTVAKRENIDLNDKNDISKFSAQMIRKHGGSKALKAAGGLYELIKPVIPEDLKEWQIFKVSKWDNEKAVSAVKWMIEDILHWNHEDIYNNLYVSTFYEHNLGGLLSKFCNHSPIIAINLAYPGEFPKLKNERPIQFVK